MSSLFLDPSSDSNFSDGYPDCAMKFINNSADFGESVHFQKGDIVDLICNSGVLACTYCCTVEFSANNEIKDVFDESGTPACFEQEH